MTRMPDEIRTSASSLRSALEEVASRGDAVPELDRAQITADVWNEFEPLYETFSKAESLLPLKEKYESVLVNTGRRVRVLDPQDPYEGTALGITEGGELIVMRDADPESGAGETLCHVGNGEISGRGIEGYI
jgi:BirA family biotin operon repressor/biotin-[acetyl-CoA-carboxylase] ligase